jgi:hypothetical protein
LALFEAKKLDLDNLFCGIAFSVDIEASLALEASCTCTGSILAAPILGLRDKPFESDVYIASFMARFFRDNL